MDISVQQFFSRTSEYLALFDVWATPFVAEAKIDHIGYKCASKEEFESLRSLLEPACDFTYQSFISGRRITLCRFQAPLKTVLGEIRFLELSDQKPDGSQVSGFDHLEIYPLKGSIEQLAERCAKAGSEFTVTLRPHHTTYDRKLAPRFSIRIEPEPLLQKIKNEEMVV